MSYYSKSDEKGTVLGEYHMTGDQMLGNFCRNSSRPMSPKGQLEQEKKLRREIANSNERRRMQSINAGFNSLKTLLPHPDGEKLSKAAILQQTADYITSLEQDKSRLLSQNHHLKQLLGDIQLDENDLGQISPPPKRKKRDTESSDEGINIPPLDDPTPTDLRREMVEIRGQLDRERYLRMMLEDQIRGLAEAQVCPDKLQNLAAQINQQMRHEVLKQKLYLEEEWRKHDEQKHELHEVKVKEEKTENTSVERHTPKTCQNTPPVPRNKAFLNSYMSRRNLDMIVEAIRHLEGDQVLLDQPGGNHRDVNNSEDSERDSQSSTTLSDQEDYKSDSLSGRESPTLMPQQHPVSHTQLQATVHVQHNGHVILSDSYANQTLLHPSLSYVSRPGVIVQKSTS